jgi:hypothetical protein
MPVSNFKFYIMNKSNEYHNLQLLYGNDWINKLLGDYKSYVYLRGQYTFKEISNEINELNINN